MDSNVLVNIHVISVVIFLLLYLIKTILLFANQNALDRFTKSTKVIEMIVSALFFITGIWLYVILGAIKVLHIVKLVLVFTAIPLAVSGFKRKRKVPAVLSLLFIIMAYGLSDMSKKKTFIPNKVEVRGDGDEASVLGMKTYAANCAMCHGLDGKKQYRKGPDISRSNLNEGTVRLMVTQGSKSEKGVMPAYRGVLKEEEIAAVSTYVFTLRK